MSGGSPIVVDASVVIKWHVEEIHSAAARRLLDDGAPEMHAPDLLFPEVGNILWKKIRRAEIREEHGLAIVRLIPVAPLIIHPSPPLLEAAFELANRTGRTVYDCLYLALAVHLDGLFVTADEKLFNALKDGPLADRLLWVEAIPETQPIEEINFEIGGGVAPYSAEEIDLISSGHTGDRLTDAELAHLPSVADLEELFLASAGITDAGMVHLRQVIRLRILDLRGARITDDGLANLNGLTNLESLNLAETGISDSGLAHLQGLVRLRNLVLWGTRVTDAGLLHLRGLTHLEHLDLEDTAVTDAGIQSLRAVLPRLKIVR